MRLQGVSLNALAERIGQRPEQLRRQAQRELAWYVADAYACGLGMHPAEVWGDDWWAVERAHEQWRDYRKNRDLARRRAARKSVAA